MVTEQLLLLIVGCLALLALLLGFRQLQVTGKLRRELNELRNLMDRRSVVAPVVKGNFSTSLDTAERQQPQPFSRRNSAEKYRYVGSLAQQGLDAEGIAEALQMAPAEVEQLLQLAKLKQSFAGKRAD
ncbi:MAG: hypothetical protein BA864_12610 [Desulfuromonadales bacterium C00003093]|nr:MAG: hypothetical protein BA864_12610 [Desulfuromonadales bacterium C00003093]